MLGASGARRGRSAVVAHARARARNVDMVGGGPTTRGRRAAIRSVVLGAVLLMSGCAHLGRRGSETSAAAQSAAVQLENSRLIEHFEDMNQRNLLLAAAAERLDVMSAERVDAPSDSIYEWNALVLRFTAQTAEFAPHDVVQCWQYVFEGKFLRSGPGEVDCPANSPIDISVPPTSPPSTYSAQFVEEFQGLRAQLSSTLESVDTHVLDSAQVQTLVRKALAKFEPDSVEAGVIQQVPAAAVRYHDLCVFGRKGDTVEVWQPVFGNAVDTCTVAKAAEGGP